MPQFLVPFDGIILDESSAGEFLTTFGSIVEEASSEGGPPRLSGNASDVEQGDVRAKVTVQL